MRRGGAELRGEVVNELTESSESVTLPSILLGSSIVLGLHSYAFGSVVMLFVLVLLVAVVLLF